ncbi:hypothetical protein LEP1GSC104_0539 [Leptospira interrogans str. UI 12621]|uniref:Uncharacterized protein n=1 Tax=Leptospira interrogans str. UI 12621 TaxID=1049937 RepID=A0A0F6H9E3_LEPIR|nr:hypothetical protein LEP1GSC104_0539 [Leptospira interrogans str. UI 12621]
MNFNFLILFLEGLSSEILFFMRDYRFISLQKLKPFCIL